MSTMSLIHSEDDPEEGEIVDDDFEDISDNSIIEPFNIGKFVSPKEHLPAISLSSVSDSDVPEREDTNTFKLRHRHRPSRKKCKSFRRKKCSHHKRHLSDSDSDEYLDRKLQKQLKAAIHVDTEECHKNSLRTRLRAMTKSDENDIIQISGKSDDDDEGKQLKESSNEPEEDLIQLRLEALRTAVLNKFEHRKKRKLKDTPQNGDDFEVIEVVDNKENTQWVNDSEPPNKKICDRKSHEVEEVIDTTPPEEDEDVLRALLLASMSKKITKEVVPTKTVLNTQIPKESVIPNHTAFFMKKVLPITASKKGMMPLKNHAINKNNFNSHMKTTAKINPIIINVDDSDTDDDSPNTTIKNVNKAEVIPKASEIESSVEKFLKEQRAKVEAQSFPANQVVTETNESPIFNKLSDSSKTESSKPTESNKPNELCKQTEPCKSTVSSKPIESCKSTEFRNNLNTPTSTSVILEKSSVKLLPKIKQIEYQKLLQKLKNAEKKPSVRRLSPTVSETKPGSNTSRKLVRNKISVPVKHNVKKVEQNPDIKSDARTLHFALKEMQRQKNGRLQIEEKYVVLTPIIKKINEASTERKKYDQEVKRLLQELAEAKNKLRETHIRFSAHVKELIKQKQDIESSCKTLKLNGGQLREAKPKIKEVTTKNRKQKDVAFTSTPKKDHPPLESFEASTIPSTTPNDTPDNTLSEVMSNCVKDKSKGDEKKTEGTSNDVVVIVEKTSKAKDIFGKNLDVIDVPINPGDPNDIDRIYKTQNVVPEYRSPLECVKRKDWFDPLAIMCPYDVDGNCRDSECIYKHYSK